MGEISAARSRPAQRPQVGRGGRQHETTAATVRGPYRWSDARIEAELRALTVERQTMPTMDELRAIGRQDLARAISRAGGSARWAARLGLERSVRQRTREPFAVETGLAQAQRLIAERGRLPSEPVLRELGFSRLATLVRHAGGSRAFCAAHGLEERPGIR